MKVVEKVYERTLDVSAEVAWWNTWDFEHVTFVHKRSYRGVQVLYRDSATAVFLSAFRAPFAPFLTTRSFDVMRQVSPRELRAFHRGAFGTVVSTVTIDETAPSRCSFRNETRLLLSGWQALLAPLLSGLMDDWNERVWREDAAVMVRRQKVLEAGFKDFGEGAAAGP